MILLVRIIRCLLWAGYFCDHWFNWFVYIGVMEKIKIEIGLGGISNLRDVHQVSLDIFHPSPAGMEKYHNVADWEEKLEKGGVLVVGKADRKIVGFILAYKTADEVMHLWNAGVLSEYRNMGIFSNMFEELAVECRRRGVKKLTLNTIEKKFPEMYKHAINKGFVEYEREWVEDDHVGKTVKSKFELSLR